MIFKQTRFILFSFFLFILLFNNVMADGKKLDLSHYKGKVVMVDFWASWCAPCRKSFPWLNKMQNDLKPAGLVVLGVNVDENTQDAKDFLEKYPANFKIIFDPDGNHAEFYKLIGMPSSLIFDREGKLVERHIGFKESQINSYQNTLQKILKQ